MMAAFVVLLVVWMVSFVLFALVCEVYDVDRETEDRLGRLAIGWPLLLVVEPVRWLIKRVRVRWIPK